MKYRDECSVCSEADVLGSNLRLYELMQSTACSVLRSDHVA